MKRSIPEQTTICRAFALKSMDPSKRGFSVVASTETPSMIFDFERGERVLEVLVASGFRLRSGNRAPLLNAHNRVSMDDVLGSAENFRNQANEVLCDVRLAEGESGDHALSLYRDGHATDVSVGYSQDETTFVPEGQTQTIGGKSYLGPLRVTTAWTIRELSLVPIGADPNAKARGENTNQKSRKEATMDPKFIEWLSARGFDPKAISEKQTESLRAVFISESAPKTEPPKIDTAAIERTAADKARAEEITRGLEIRGACQVFGVEDQADGMIKDGTTLDQARAKIQDILKNKPKPGIAQGVTLSMGDTDNMKFNRAAVDGLIIRGGTHIAKPAPGFEEFRGKSLLRLAEMCLERAGIRTKHMDSAQIATAALRMGQRGAYTIAGSSADFANIVMDASNVSLQKGFEEAQYIWRLIASVGSASDFKTIHRIQLFEAQDLVTIQENGSYTEAKFIDGEESYAIDSKGLRFTISRKAIINDSASAFSRVPRLLGVSAGRTIEKTVLGLLTGGLTTTLMKDATVLFTAAHKNITTGAALSAANLALDITAMMSQYGRGADGATVPAFVMPKYSLVPVALKLTNDVICSPLINPTVAAADDVAKAIKNMGIIPLSSLYLDIADSKRRYLLPDPNLTDSLEVSFLNGVQTPMLEEVDQTDADGRIFKVRLDVGAGVLDWRGALTNAGQ